MDLHSWIQENVARAEPTVQEHWLPGILGLVSFGHGLLRGSPEDRPFAFHSRRPLPRESPALLSQPGGRGLGPAPSQQPVRCQLVTRMLFLDSP